MLRTVGNTGYPSRIAGLAVGLCWESWAADTPSPLGGCRWQFPLVKEECKVITTRHHTQQEQPEQYTQQSYNPQDAGWYGGAKGMEE